MSQRLERIQMHKPEGGGFVPRLAATRQPERHWPVGFMITDWFESRFDLPPIRIPNLYLYEPEEAARALRQEWELGEKPISNMLHLLESKGARVFSLSENTKKVDA